MLLVLLALVLLVALLALGVGAPLHTRLALLLLAALLLAALLPVVLLALLLLALLARSHAHPRRQPHGRRALWALLLGRRRHGPRGRRLAALARLLVLRDEGGLLR
eukprot:scaffold4722_cov60-Phaeocystis_antarctica.AAC.8